MKDEMMLQIATFYKRLLEDNKIAGGIGQGGGNYWQDAVGIRLQTHLAVALGGNLTMKSRPHGLDSFDRTDYDPQGHYDIAYCQPFELPTERPAEWVYTIISDYINMEGLLEEFLDAVRPNLVISLQYPLIPPSDRPNLVEQCARYGTKVLFMPWFNDHQEKDWELERNVTAMCTGAVGSFYYPMRDKIYRFLEGLSRDDIIISVNAFAHVFPLNDADYQNALRRCQYYVTGGIYDIQIPPKYYEVCNYGATLVTPPMPMLKESGFVDGETCIVINSLPEIEEVMKTDAWKTVGPAGRAMVQERHSLDARAQDIANAYIEDIEAMV